MSETNSVGALGKVNIGGKDIVITRFRGQKAILAGALVARVMRQTPEINKKIAEFRKQYRKDNFIELTRGMAKTPRFADWGLTAEDFGDKMAIELPEEPDAQAIFSFIFPEIFDLAQKELLTFFALIVIPDAELELADEADKIDEVLEKKGKELVKEAYLDELLELAVVGWEVLQDQIMRKRDRLGKLRSVPFLQTLLSTPEDPKAGEETTPPTSTPEPQTSSTDSPDSTDGIDERSSTESPGTSLSSSSPSTVAS